MGVYNKEINYGYTGYVVEEYSSGSYLLNIYARSCFSELTHMDYEHFSEEQQLEFLNLLHRILNLFDFLKQ